MNEHSAFDDALHDDALHDDALHDDARAAAAAVDEARLWRRLMDMARHGATPAGGVNRQAFSAEDIAARKTMLAWAAELGLEAATDAIGNLYLRRPGSDPGADPVMTGSHLDSQPRGGKYDGAYGVLAGLEALQAMNDAGTVTRRPLEVVAWSNEEGSRFQPGTMGSGVFSGHMAMDALLPRADSAGVTLEDALRDFLASTPDLPRRPGRIPLAGYLEAHIEQGPRLEVAGLAIGAVTAVQGMTWYDIEVIGEAAHTGTTPHALRRDALKAATAMVQALTEAMADPDDRVRFTVGRFEVEPGSPNTVPARAFFTIDLRHPDAATIARLAARIEPLCRAHAQGCQVTVGETAGSTPTVFDPAVVEVVRQAARAVGEPAMDMVSGAGHDAMHIANLCPTAMVFVPCEKGISHNEAESATPADLAAGARVVTASLVALANR